MYKQSFTAFWRGKQFEKFCHSRCVVKRVCIEMHRKFWTSPSI